MVPGANEGLPNSLSSGNRPDDRRQTSTVSVNGQNDVLNNNLIDGMDNNERYIGTIGVRPSVDAIAEVKVQTNMYTAETGRTAGAVVNILTKSGTNDFHGSGYGFFRNEKFDAYDFFARRDQPKPRLRQQQWGGSLGGRIIRNQTFFFADYERYHQERGVTFVSTVPTRGDAQRRLLGAARPRHRHLRPADHAAHAVPQQRHPGQPHRPGGAALPQPLSDADGGRVWAATSPPP